jgi:quinol-cytochrome oxidoreductase complex cytochrome b subunit
MSRFAIPSLVVGLVVVVLAVIALLLGLYLLPGRAESIERGVYMPWVIVWLMIALTDLCALALAGFLVSVGLKGLSTDAPSRI